LKKHEKRIFKAAVFFANEKQGQLSRMPHEFVYKLTNKNSNKKDKYNTAFRSFAKAA
jgi:intergrase/recombinase